MVLFGRSSSHFTRITRLFAAELEVDVEFHLIGDLLSTDADDYGGHPALDIVWPEDLHRPVASRALDTLPPEGT